MKPTFLSVSNNESSKQKPINPQKPYVVKPQIKTSKSTIGITLAPTLPLKGTEASRELIQTYSSFDFNSKKPTKNNSDHESSFDQFIAFSNAENYVESIEQFVREKTKAETVYYWQDIPSINQLYCNRINKSAEHSQGVIGYTFFSREILVLEKLCSHASFSHLFDSTICSGQSRVLVFPLFDNQNTVCSVVQAIKGPKETPFSSEDIDFVKFFTRKFIIYSKFYIENGSSKNILEDFKAIMETDQYLRIFQKIIPNIFCCQKAEIWRYELSSNVLTRFFNDATVLDIKQSGIAGESLLRHIPINAPINKMQSSYSEQIDGTESEAVLVIPYHSVKLNMKWAVCLRGKINCSFFTIKDEDLLHKHLIDIVISFDNSIRYTDAINSQSVSSTEHDFVKLLNHVSEIVESGASFSKILESSLALISKIIKCDRAYCFEFDHESEFYVSIASYGSSIPIRIEKNRGIIGKVYQNGNMLNLSNIQKGDDADYIFELSSGYRTHSILSIPLKNQRNEIISVIQLINKLESTGFSLSDVKYAKVYGVVLGAIKELEELHSRVSLSEKGTDSYCEMSTILTSGAPVKESISSLMMIIKAVMEVQNCSLFLFDKNTNSLLTYFSDNPKVPLSISTTNGIAFNSISRKTPQISNDPYHDPAFNRSIDQITGILSQSILSCPIIDRKGRVLGCIELINRKDGKPFQKCHQKSLVSFSNFVSVLFEAKSLKERIEIGELHYKLEKSIGIVEKDSFRIPMKLQLPSYKVNESLSLDFCAFETNPKDLEKIAFLIFNHFGLLEAFRISSETFYGFLYHLKNSYRETSYHNWYHAIDVLQYVAYQTIKTRSHTILTPLELLAVCTSAISHDIGHFGLNNKYHTSAQTPYGQLYCDRSVMETLHCSELIRIVSLPEANIFKSLDQNNLQTLWKWIIHLILATDMAFHFKFINEAEEILSQKALNMKEESHRLLAMELIIKVADVSNVSRPFKIAEKWAYMLQEEFFFQGDMEKEQGIDVSSSSNIRGEANIPKSQVGFITYFCVPLYSIIARIFPELIVNLESLNTNLILWKSKQIE